MASRPRADKSTPTHPTPATPTSEPRILVTDDHDIVCQGVQSLLSRAYPESTVCIALNAEAALEQLRKHVQQAVRHCDDRNRQKPFLEVFNLFPSLSS
jgi:hypothetical protein